MSAEILTETPAMKQPFVVIELSGKPRGKARARTNPHSKVPYTDAKSRAADKTLTNEAQAAMAGRLPTADYALVTIDQRFPISPSWPKWKQAAARAGRLLPDVKPDWDNIAKLTDCLNQVVFRDDKQVVFGTIAKYYADNPGMTIVVTTRPRPVAPPRSVKEAKPAAGTRTRRPAIEPELAL